jgi:hypothetical protein
VEGGWRRLHNEELHYLYASPDIVRMMRSRRMKWAGHVARMGEISSLDILAGRPEGKNNSEDLGEDGKITLEWILGKWSGKLWTGFIWLRIGTSGGLL